MFVVDDLVGWLIGQLATAGYQKLSTRLRGTDQERALKQAVTAAVQATVGEIGPSDREEADRVAQQINKAFRRRDPVPLPPGQPTVLEALQAGIAAQLSALDDAGQPGVSLPGAPVSEVADKLTGHLVREIIFRGSQPGPLTPLADRLNHDQTHLQGQRIEGKVDQVLDRLGDGPTSPGTDGGPLRWPLAEVADPFALEVHRPIEPDVPQPGLPVLPVYMPREHDIALAEVVTAAAARISGIAVLVGGSSTGKTRACWQALELLRAAEPGWRLWHPIDAQAALAGLPSVGQRTVLWLNDAERYLDTADAAGEQVAAKLRELLQDQDRGPVLMLGTLWPEYWDELTARPPGAADLHAQARELLGGHDIPVPAAFTDEQLRQLEKAGDPRLAQAATGSRDGQVIQYLAGAPYLLHRYDTAPPAARALIDAAIDASRLGMRPALPRAFLNMAAPGYLTDTDWNLQPGDWLKEALRYTARPAMGVLGPLAPIRPRPGSGIPDSPGDGPAWRLADYLYQHGRRARRELIPPAPFWAAAASYADPADLGNLGEAAENRGLYRDAARLYKQASGHGFPAAGARLVRLLHTLYPGDQRPADWAAAHASLDDPHDVDLLLRALRDARAADQVTALLGRDPATHASLDDPYGVDALLWALRDARAAGQVTALATRVADHASLDDPDWVAFLLGKLRQVGASDAATALAARAAAHVSLDDPIVVAILLDALLDAEAADQVTTLLGRDPATHASLDDPSGVAGLLGDLRDARAAGQVTTLLGRDPATHASLDDPVAVDALLRELRAAGATGQVTALATRVADHASLDNPDKVALLLRALREAGATGQVTALLGRDPATHASLDNPDKVALLLRALRDARAADQVTALATRAADHASLDDPYGADALLRALREAGATGQVTALATRVADHADLDNPSGVAFLLGALREAGATGQAAALATRAADHASLDNPDWVDALLRALREAGAVGQVTALATRAADHADLDNPDKVALRLGALREAGAVGQAAALATRAADHAGLGDPYGVALLLGALREAGAADQVTTLLGRDPATHASLDDPSGVAFLLGALREAGATGQAAALATRAADHASLGDPSGVSELLRQLNEAGAQTQAAELIERLPASGLFELFCWQEGRQEQFRFGREADGRPAERWAWTDLG